MSHLAETAIHRLTGPHLARAHLARAHLAGAHLARTRSARPQLLRALVSPAGPAHHVRAAALPGLLSPVTGILTHPVSAAAGGIADAGLAAIDGWMLLGSRGALDETAHVIGTTTTPQLDSTWFSSTYWRVAALAALLTVPFLFAAALQALLRSDLALLLRAAFGYLPLALLGVSIAAPVTMLLVSATDEMCSVVSAAGSGTPADFLLSAGLAAGTLSLAGDPGFLGFAVSFLTACGALVLALELLIREAAMYVVVLLLPLAFAALVWPARRVWAIRAVELLVALILSKFVIVAVLALADAAFSGGVNLGAGRLLTAMALVILGAFAPWAMVRLLPFTELAAGASGAIRPELSRVSHHADRAAAVAGAGAGADWVTALPALMRRDAEQGADPSLPPGPVDAPAMAGGSARDGRAAADPGSAGAVDPDSAGGAAGSASGATSTGEIAGGAAGTSEDPEPGGGWEVEGPLFAPGRYFRPTRIDLDSWPPVMQPDVGERGDPAAGDPGALAPPSPAEGPAPPPPPAGAPAQPPSDGDAR
jgi:hypothetical protein